MSEIELGFVGIMPPSARDSDQGFKSAANDNGIRRASKGSPVIAKSNQKALSKAYRSSYWCLSGPG